MIPRYVFIPLLLFVFLIAMIIMGYDSYKAGLTSPLLYFGGSAITMACIVGLYFHLKTHPTRKKRTRNN